MSTSSFIHFSGSIPPPASLLPCACAFCRRSGREKSKPILGQKSELVPNGMGGSDAFLFCQVKTGGGVLFPPESKQQKRPGSQSWGMFFLERA